MSDFYPSNLRFVMNELSGFSRMRNKLTLPFASAKANDLIYFKLPANVMCDLASLTFSFECSTTGSGYAVLPQYTSSLIETLSIDINGISVQQINNYNHLFKQLSYLQAGDQERRNGYLEWVNMTPQAPPANMKMNKVSLVIKQWLGLLQNKIIDTSILGEITVSMRLAPNSILIASSADAAYELTTMSVQFDSVNLDNNVFKQSMYRQLENGGIKWVYQNPICNIGGSSQFPCSQTFSVSTQSLDYLYSTLLSSNYNTISADASGNMTGGNRYIDKIDTSAYFSHGTSGVNSCQAQIGTVLLPNFKPNLAEVLSYSLDSLGLTNDVLGTSVSTFKPHSFTTDATNPRTTAIQLNTFADGQYCFCARLCHGDKGPNNSLISGLSTQGTNTSITIRHEADVGTTGNFMGCTWAICSSTLTIGAARQISVTI